MLSLHAHIQIHPGREKDFELLAHELWAETHEREQGVRRYEYLRLEDQGRYLVCMLFDDHEAFITHQASPHHIDLAGRMRELIAEMTLSYGQPVDEAFGVPDDAGAPLGVEIADGMRQHYVERYPAPEATWWT